MNVLITGGSGLLGQYLNFSLSASFNILTLRNSNSGNCLMFNSAEIDLTNRDMLKEIFLSFKPGIVVHTAAISRPETCDRLPRELVIDVNVNSTIELAKLCDMHNAKLIFTSTDLVYDGESGQYLGENSLINPVSLYAETKVMSENEISNIFDNFIILRTSLLFGIGLNHSLNNFHVMFYNFKNHKPVKLFYDQFRTPLSLKDASMLIAKLIRTEAKGVTLNFGGRERVSRVQLGEILCDLGNFDKDLIVRTSMADVPGLQKVADVSMNTDKLRSLGLEQNSIEGSVMEILTTYNNS